MDCARIMIVEDEPIVAVDMQRGLEQLGYDVRAVASSGEEAIEKAALEDLDLALMDINLQGEMDGLETALRLRNQLNIPVVYITAYVDDATLERAKLTEPLGYIVKPFEGRAIHATIQMGLHRHNQEQVRDLKVRQENYRSATSAVVRFRKCQKGKGPGIPGPSRSD